ncbi:MAG: glutaminase A [Enterobacteriaceae bacterium]|jgi:glutaminase|nr:glutaminase A [Enterobacteriaceae bacterium]
MKHKIGAVFFLSLFLFQNASAATAPDVHYSELVQKAYKQFKDDKRGDVADYIPALAKYSPDNYAIAIATVDGKIYTAGDKNKLFPLESLTKVFTLALAMNQQGPEKTLDKLGANATGLPFNSGLAVELRNERPQNPLVNAGAISSVSLIDAKNADDRWQQVMSNMEAFADNKLSVNDEVYRSELETNQHNQALAYLMLSYGRMYSNPAEAVDIYTRQCSVEASTIDLAKMGAVLANGGKSPYTGNQLVAEENVPKVLAEMAVAGLYDGSGKWLYNVGIPAKSGVGGGMFAVVPGKYAIAVYSPPLDKEGNSIRAQEAIEYIANETQANLFR